MNSQMGFSSKLRRLRHDHPRGARHGRIFAPHTCMGLFLSSDCFWVFLTVLCSERERPFFVPSPAIRFPERAEGVKGPKR